ncbi:hypothetical protein WMY93_016339 [Mugilogobius chulae]|uniref:Protein ripply2 n=1 Tax=Mugilogobius chulae TaxID=88201 RepID=A0AAW0NTT9_9GOBI
MEKLTFTHGFTANGAGLAHQQQRVPLWRPWTGTSGAVTLPAPSVRHDVNDSSLVKPCFQVVHPVKLFWPKSKCFDYLYQDAEQLLRNYPVQATICPCDDCSDSDSSDESDCEEEEEEEEEEENKSKTELI